jgi:undecaprenyl-diphosphatase
MISLLFVPGFGFQGLAQWCRRKSLKKVDRSLLTLGGVYLGLMVFFVFFECFPVNYRPILIEGRLEASYPSSTTLLALSVLPTAAMQFHVRIQNGRLRWCVVLLLVLLTVFLVVGRILSGVHWITDVIGGILLSGGLVTLYWVGQE